MQISVGTDNVHFSPVDVKNASEFLEYALEYNWSPSVFRDNYRNKENFISADLIALDIDNDEPVRMTIEEAAEAFKDYRHLIMPSRSHRKEKNGEVKDRFRVLLFLTRQITDEKEYYATWYELQKRCPAADPSCKDPSRFYYPSTECFSKNLSKSAKTIDPVEPKPQDLTPLINEVADSIVESRNEFGQIGELSGKTHKFMNMGARPGHRHRELYKAARDYHQNGYAQEQFVADVNVMIAKTGNWAHPKLTVKDIKTIEDAFRVDPKHGIRGGWTRAFLFQPLSEVLKTETKLDWLIDRFLTVGGLSLIAGPPKAGKSTLIRQLQRSVCRGEKFLERKTKKGTVYCLALEEQEELLKEQYEALGLTDADDIYIHTGSPLSQNYIETLSHDLSQNKVALLVIDTLMLATNIAELNSYSDVNKALTPLRDLARETGTHVLLIHHSNKHGIGAGAILGSNAIAGAVDTFMVFQKIGKDRRITTQGRGIKDWHDHELIFDSETETYSLGEAGGFADEQDNDF